jgi:hypothetical protein
VPRPLIAGARLLEIRRPTSGELVHGEWSVGARELWAAVQASPWRCAHRAAWVRSVTPMFWNMLVGGP